MAVIRRSVNTPRDLVSYASFLQDRLDAIARAQALADQFGEVNLQTIVADELLKHGALEGERLSLTGPVIALTPRTGQVLALAIHELAVNAVEHGGLGSSDGRIEVWWSVADVKANLPTRFSWTETGGTATDGPRHNGFGTEVLTRMLPYECRAEAEMTFGTDGLRYTVHFAEAG